MTLRVSCLCLATALITFVPRAEAQSPLTPTLSKWNELQAEIGNKVSEAGAQVKLKASQIPTIPAPPTARPQPVSAAQKAFLLSKISEFVDHANSEDSLFTRWAVGLIIAAGTLALIGAILSFARKHIIAGVAGLIVTAIIGFANAYPLNALSDFYRELAAQATALKVECELKEPLTADFYNSEATQLKLLYLSEGSKRPGLGNYKSAAATTQKLITEMATVKTSADQVERTRGLM